MRGDSRWIGDVSRVDTEWPTDIIRRLDGSATVIADAGEPRFESAFGPAPQIEGMQLIRGAGAAAIGGDGGTLVSRYSNGGQQAFAALDGRDYVIPDDVKALALPALRRRIVLSPGAEIDGQTTDGAVS